MTVDGRGQGAEARWMDPRALRVEQRFETPMLVAALLVVPVLVIENSDVSSGLQSAGTALNWGIWLAFVFEAIVMSAVVGRRLEWARTHPLEVVIVVLTPPILPVALSGLRLLRLLRVLRLLRLAKSARTIFSLEGVKYAAILAALATLGGGLAFAASEQGVNVWMGIYWAISTVTTVGYGDVVPHTTLSHVVAVVLMLVGPAFAALLIGAVAEHFVTPLVDDAEEEEAVGAELDVAAEVHDIAQRLARLEAHLAQRRQG